MASKTSHLSLLMKELGVSGNMLGEYLRVDNSLISKWRSGSRKISMDYLDNLVRLFLSLDESNQYQRLQRVTGFSGAEYCTPEQMGSYLRLWLTTSEEGERNTLESFVSKQSKPINGYFFTGESGKLEAVRSFLAYSAQGHGQKIWLYSQQGTDWLLRDADHRFEWQNRNFAVLENNEIYVLHPVYKDYRHIAEYMLRWIPLHMYGEAFAYYIPQYQLTASDFTLCLTEGAVGLVSITAAGDPNRIITYLLSDPESLQSMKDLMTSYFRQSKPLFSRFSYADSIQYCETYRRFCKGRANGICITAGPPLFLIRRALLQEFLQGEYSKILPEISFEKSSQNGLAPITVVFQLDQMRNLLRPQRALLRTLSYYAGHQVSIRQDQFRQCLTDILDLAETESNIRILVTEHSPFYPYNDIDMFVREQEIAGFVSSYYHTERITRALTLQERTVVSALYHNLDYYVNTHPNRDMQLSEVRACIEDLFRRYPIETCTDGPYVY